MCGSETSRSAEAQYRRGQCLHCNCLTKCWSTSRAKNHRLCSLMCSRCPLLQSPSIMQIDAGLFFEDGNIFINELHKRGNLLVSLVALALFFSFRSVFETSFNFRMISLVFRLLAHRLRAYKITWNLRLVQRESGFWLFSGRGVVTWVCMQPPPLSHSAPLLAGDCQNCFCTNHCV